MTLAGPCPVPLRRSRHRTGGERSRRGDLPALAPIHARRRSRRLGGGVLAPSDLVGGAPPEMSAGGAAASPISLARPSPRGVTPTIRGSGSRSVKGQATVPRGRADMTSVQRTLRIAPGRDYGAGVPAAGVAP